MVEEVQGAEGRRTAAAAAAVRTGAKSAAAAAVPGAATRSGCLRKRRGRRWAPCASGWSSSSGWFG